MASTYSPSLRLELMATGDQSGTWGDTTNTNLGTLLEQAITGVLSVAEGDAELTLTALDGASDQSRNMVVNLTGAMTGPQNVIVPTANKLYLIKNSTTGGFAVTVKTSAGTGVAVAAGTAQWVYCDGTNVVQGLSGTMAVQAPGAVAITGGTMAGVTISDYLALAGGTMTGQLVNTGSSAGYTPIQLVSTEASAAAGPIIELYRNSATPAASDIIGQLLFNGEDSAGNTQEYGSIEAVVADATSASEDGTLDAYVPIAGTRTRVLSLGPNMSVPTNSNNVTTAPGIAFLGDANTGIGSSGAGVTDFVNGGVNVGRIASTGARSWVIPSGSTLYPAFECRAWVNFNGTGTPAIRGSGNVSSITDNGIGNFTINFTTAMPDENYSWGMGGSANTAYLVTARADSAAPTTSALRIGCFNAAWAAVDGAYVCVQIFR